MAQSKFVVFENKNQFKSKELCYKVSDIRGGGTPLAINQSINQSINAEFVGRRYTTRPGAPAESVKSTIK